MNNLVKLLVVALLAIGIFGGGGFLAYRLFFKKSDPGHGKANEAVVTPTPDPGIEMFDEAKRLIASGDQSEAQKTLLALIQSFPDSTKSNDARKLLGDLNVSAFFSKPQGPIKLNTLWCAATRSLESRLKPKTRPNLSLRPTAWTA